MEKRKKAVVNLLLLSLLTFSVVPYFNVNAQTCDPDALVSVSFGQRGSAVRNAQACLMEAGYDIPAGATGYYGSQTRKAVAEFYADWYGSWSGNSLGPRGVAELKSRLATAPEPEPTQPSGNEQILQQILNLLQQNRTSEAFALLLALLAGGQTPTTTPTTTQPAPSGEVSVSLAPDNPPAGTLIASQTGANLLKFVVKNDTTSTVTINSLKVKRGGVSSDSTLSNVYLYANDQRISDTASLTQGYATFTGLNVQIPAGSSVTFSVVADVADQTQGQTVNISVVSPSDVGGVTVSGNFPLAGNTFTIASKPNDFASLSVSNVQPNSPITINAGTNAYSVFKATVQVNNREVLLKGLRLRMIGSIAQNDLQNFALYVDGQQVATSSLGSDNYVSFVPSSPYTLRAGSRILEVRADVVGGSTRQFSFSLRYPSDLNVVDSQYGVGVPISGVPASTASVQVGGVSLTVQKLPLDTNYVVKDSRKTLAKFEFRAYGEPVKIESLNVQSTSSNLVAGLRNGAIYVNGSQVGSTQTISKSTSGTQFNNLNFIVNPGTPAIVEIVADVTDASDSNKPPAGTTDLQINLLGGSGQGTQSLNLVSVSSVNGNQLTVVSGTAQLIKNSSYGDPTFVKGKQGAKIASYVVVGDPYENLTINSFTVDLSSNNAHQKLQNLRLSVNPSDVRGIPAPSNTFSLNINVPAGGQLLIDVFADVLTSLTNLPVTSTPQASVSYIAQSGQSGAVPNVSGQLVTIADHGTLTASLSPQNPPQQYVITNSENVEFLRVKLNADNKEAIKVEEVTVTATTSEAGYFKNIEVNGTEQITWESVSSTAQVTFRNLNIQVPQNGSIDLVVKADIAPWAQVNATTGVTTTFAITSIKYRGVDSGEATTTTTTLSGNQMTVYRSRLDAALVGTGIKGPSTAHDVAYLNLRTSGNESGYQTSNLAQVKLTFRGTALAPYNTATTATDTIDNFVSLYEGNTLLATATATETDINTGVFEATLNVPNNYQLTGATRQLTIRLNTSGVDNSQNKYFTVAVENLADIQWNDGVASNAGLNGVTSPLSNLQVTVQY